ncbi:MAG: dihydrolipoamide acetyltransferase family protein [Candidatus Aminicenantes bacterium]|nr:dihydrolipoamide acetyltransferase family protein [Candidatus Aminicenantes bacterium]
MTDLRMPAYGISDAGGTVIRWLKEVGDAVHAGESLVLVETEKAAVELDSPATGILREIRVSEGHVAVAQLLAVIEDEAAAGEPPISCPAPGELTGMPSAAEPVAEAPVAPRRRTRPARLSAGPNVRAAPAARRLARKHGVDLAGIRGTGPRGRIVRADVEQLIGASQPAAAADAPGSGPTAEREELSQIRRVVARRMMESATIPQFHLTVDADASGLLKAQREWRQAGRRVSITAFLVKKLAELLERNRRFNASWKEDHIEIHREVNINVAVATDRGLLVPVLRDCASKTIDEIEEQLGDLVDRARKGRTRPEEFAGGTFTLSNLGMYGIREFNGLINPPQSALLAVGEIRERPFVDQSVIGIRPEMSLTLAADHRVVDGTEAAQFLDVLRKSLTRL